MNHKAKKRPKVGIFTRPIDQGTSGSGSHLEKLVSHILEINNNFDIILIHYYKNNKDIYKKTEELIIPRNPVLASLKLRRERFDILHYAPLTIYSPIWFTKSIRVATIHGGASYLLPEKYSIIEKLHENIIRPFYARRMKCIFTVSKTSKELLIKRNRVNENKIKITYNAVNNKFCLYEHIPEAIKEKYGISSSFVFHLSKFSERKNPWTMLAAFNILKKVLAANKSEKRDIKFLIGGDGWDNRKVIEFAKKNEILDDMVFLGFVPEDDLVLLLNLAEVFVFPSLYEGFGMPNLEAMACGCPVITSNTFAIPEIVGDAALLLENYKDPEELAGKILLILNDSVLRKNLKKKGLERVKLFSWQKSAETVLNTYQKYLVKG